ncbi:hypothetical protein AVEN_73303-1 [Araneus ventricosus]|uniref:Uncharacterized protein n=1 Tax=Araneus ventricosus TaxID=182803 RepID=A0A4Y2TC82_ARAVE|nr:hypothetical protein AVEN_73303-1 [Araneus ventricosus]
MLVLDCYSLVISDLSSHSIICDYFGGEKLIQYCFATTHSRGRDCSVQVIEIPQAITLDAKCTTMLMAACNLCNALCNVCAVPSNRGSGQSHINRKIILSVAHQRSACKLLYQKTDMKHILPLETRKLQSSKLNIQISREFQQFGVSML